MLKLIYSDTQSDKVCRVKGHFLSLKKALDFSCVDRSKLTLKKIYSDNRKFTVCYTDNDYLMAVKPFSTKNKSTFWFVAVNKKSDKLYLFYQLVGSLDKAINYIKSFPLISENIDNDILRLHPECEILDITDINKIWFTQMRGETLL